MYSRYVNLCISTCKLTILHWYHNQSSIYKDSVCEMLCNMHAGGISKLDKADTRCSTQVDHRISKGTVRTYQQSFSAQSMPAKHQENLVMTSPYERPSSIQTYWGRGVSINTFYVPNSTYLQSSLSHQNQAKSELVSTHNKNGIIK